MPWTVDDVEGHIKGLNKGQKKVWINVANSVLKRCISSGKKEKVCEGSAIKQANAVAKNAKIHEGEAVTSVVYDESGWIINITEHGYEFRLSHDNFEEGIDFAKLIEAFDSLQHRWRPKIHIYDSEGEINNLANGIDGLYISVIGLPKGCCEDINYNILICDQVDFYNNYKNMESGKTYSKVLKSIIMKENTYGR